MKAYNRPLLILLLFFTGITFSKELIIADVDKDGVNDTIKYDRKNSMLILKLSSNNFKAIKSKRIDYVGSASGIELTKNGFKFYNNQMREGYTCQFRFDKKTNKVQLIGMDRFNDGNAQHDGSGESSVNLLTNKYIGNWNYFDLKNKKLVKIAQIEESLIIPKTYLEGFSEKQPEYYRERCDALYIKYKPKK